MKRLSAFLLVFLLFSATAWAFEFSADTIMTTREGKTAGKIFFKTDRFRMDMNAGGKMSVITRMDRKVVWSVMHDQKMYMEMPFNPEQKNRPMVEKKMEGEVDRKQVGAERIDGHPSIKYLITYKSAGRNSQVYQWWATDINFPVKTAALDGTWSQEFRNIRMVSQPDSLFEVPAGYKKFAMPGGMSLNMQRRKN